MTDIKDEIIMTDNPFTEEQMRTVKSLLNIIIPRFEEGAMPGAGEVDILGYSQERGVDLVPVLQQALEKLTMLADEKEGVNFDSLPEGDRKAAVDKLLASQPDIFMDIVLNTFAGYYRDDQVLESIGLEPRSPFPEGNEIIQGDMSLLDPVRERGKFYRE